MGDVKVPEQNAPRGPLFYVGAAGLLLAMGVEGVAVLGRHVGIPFLGALEIIQTAILLTATAAMVSATLNRAHASVTLLTERVSERTRLVLAKFSAFLSTLFFFALAAGSLWLTIDAWNEFEQSELLHISFRPLRVITLASVLAIAVLFLRDLFQRKGEQQ